MEEEVFFDYNKEPGEEENSIKMPEDTKPIISIITSYYKSNQYIEQTYNCIVSQTFPYWEWIIVDDGSDNKEAIELIEKIEKRDSRIHVYHKENEGLAKGRDYAISKASTEYIFPLDADDLIEKTMLECSYFAMLCFPEATWAYSNIVGFGSMKYLDCREFDINRMKTDNQITATALIKKEKILELGGYGKAERYINEDWHLWLRMLQKRYFPIHMHFYGLWYRRKETGSLLKEINNPNNPNNTLRIEALKQEADKINSNVNAIELPGSQIDTIVTINCDDWKKIYQGDNILIIVKALKTDTHVLEIVKREKEKHITILTSEGYLNIGRQWYEDYAEIFDMQTFLSTHGQKEFISYIIKTRSISKVYVCNEPNFSSVLDDKVEVIVDNYIEDESKYIEYKKRYEFNKSIVGKIIKKIKRGKEKLNGRLYNKSGRCE